MIAAVLTHINEPLELLDIEPQLLNYGQVYVRMICSGICGAQLQEIRGEKGNEKHLPHLIGHEGCGIVEDIGPGVTRVKPGDKVCLHWRKGEGIEADVPRYNQTGTSRMIGAGKVTTMSEYSIVSENRITPVPNDAPAELVALLGCGLSTALGTVEREAQVKMGESVLIVGVGGLGSNLIRACKLAKAAQITCCDLHKEKEKMAIDLGATGFLCSAPDDKSHRTGIPRCNTWADQIPNNSFDVIIETSGDREVFSDVFPKLAASGRMILVGHQPPGLWNYPLNLDSLFGGEGKTIKATQGGGFKPSTDIPRYISAWKTKALNYEDVITHRFNLFQINEAISLVQKGSAGRVMIHIGSEK